jgi:hypothetical protein
MPVQPGATGPRQIPDTRTRPVAAQPGGRRDGAGRSAGGARDVRGREHPPRSRGLGRWGTWQGGLGVCIVVASAAIGAVATIVTRTAPGFRLEAFVVAGTVIAALAVRPRAGRMILPVPALAYLVAALVSGVIFDRAADSSRTELALAATQWIASGFFAMALATVLAGVITAVRWFLWHRRHLDSPQARGRDWTAPPAGAARAGNRTARPGPGQTGPGSRGTGRRPGSGPYNFSSGA